MRTINHWIDGKEVPASSGTFGPVYNPATGEQQAQVGFATVSDVDAAVATAKEAFATWRAASLYDAGRPCGAEANAAKYFAGEAGFRACETAVLTHGGMGYAKEYHVERYLRECMIHRIAPITPHLILCYIAERVLGLPKSY